LTTGQEFEIFPPNKQTNNNIGEIKLKSALKKTKQIKTGMALQ